MVARRVVQWFGFIRQMQRAELSAWWMERSLMVVTLRFSLIETLNWHECEREREMHGDIVTIQQLCRESRHRPSQVGLTDCFERIFYFLYLPIGVTLTARPSSSLIEEGMRETAFMWIMKRLAAAFVYLETIWTMLRWFLIAVLS